MQTHSVWIANTHSNPNSIRVSLMDF